MKNKKNIWFLIVLVIPVFLFGKKKMTPTSSPDLRAPASGRTSATPSELPAPKMPISPPASDTSTEVLNRKSLQDMAQTLFQFTQPESRLSDLVQYLESSRQKPVVVHNSNPDTGDMVIVRTQSPLPGTRYFHAQYFADDQQKSFVQHMSFEYKPGEMALNDAVQSLKTAFPNLPAPKMQKSDFVQWDLGNGYILWAKKLSADDLKDDPFNAYSKEDVGTIRVAMELEIHGDDPSHE